MSGHPSRNDRTDEEILQRWAELRGTGIFRKQAAAELGMTPSAFYDTLARARAAGDERGASTERAGVNTRPPLWEWDEALTEWEQVLRPSGCTYEDAADRLGGMSAATFERKMQRSRAEGDERAKPPARDFGGVYGPQPTRLPRDPVNERDRGTTNRHERAEQQARERTELLASWDSNDREDRDMERRERLTHDDAHNANGNDQDVEVM